MKEEMKGLYAAVVLSIAVIFVTNLFFPKKPAVTPTAETQKVELTTKQQTDKKTSTPSQWSHNFSVPTCHLRSSFKQETPGPRSGQFCGPMTSRVQGLPVGSGDQEPPLLPTDLWTQGRT